MFTGLGKVLRPRGELQQIVTKATCGCRNSIDTSPKVNRFLFYLEVK